MLKKSGRWHGGGKHPLDSHQDLHLLFLYLFVAGRFQQVVSTAQVQQRSDLLKWVDWNGRSEKEKNNWICGLK